MDEPVLITQAQAGDHRAFGALVDEYREGVLGMASWMLKSPDDAEDAVQEATLRAWRNITTFDPARSRFETWFRFITRREVYRLRDLYRPARVREEDWLNQNLPEPMPPERADPVPRILAAVDRLPDKERTVFRMRAIEGAHFHDIAERIGYLAKSGAWHVHQRARRMLAQDLTEHPPGVILVEP